MNSITSLKIQISDAISTDKIQPFIQPIVNINRKLAGFEVLARWIVSENEIRLPLKFIPIIKDDQQLSEDLTISLLQQLIKHFTIHCNNDLFLSINIYSHSLTVTVVDLLTKLNDFINVVIEILENDDISNINNFKIILHYLKIKGIKIALDDFGCGNNINDRLFDYPFDYVKIDKLFVSDIDNNRQKRESLQSMVQLIHFFNLPIIAEGVENEHVFKLLTTLEIEMYQGYLFSKPVPLTDKQYQQPLLISNNFENK
ncbi:EAL domain-containing protein [Photobacterium sp. S4TG1]|uniref:EAL domain-containing protein n=1 Tax=Photobacterium sp. S4TG1 TaxID=3114587 RepID=UPI002E172318|nr:EAL domain-containing protein [Photobacterium sp. S4TG1]